MAPEERSRAVAIGVQLPGVDDTEQAASLDELKRLGKTLGVEVVERISQKRSALAAGAVLGEGKLEELAARVQELSVRTILVDHEITPSQARNLEKITGAEVLDRTALILAIFQRHAHSRGAQLQVEIARLSYLAPRLRESSSGRDRQSGGIGGKGAGEAGIELDRRKLRDRIAQLRQELAAIERDAETRRQRRTEVNTVALVGYTNAGKSSLMRALTGSGVRVADQLFATLDTTVRALQPPTHPRILISDTVGFIKKLPHDLIASFRSTLDEASDASLLVQVVDASDPAHLTQMEVTREVLHEIGADAESWLVVLNKIDRVDAERRAELASRHPGALLLSAKRSEDVALLRDRLIAFFEREMVEDEVLVPYSRQRMVGDIHSSCRVLTETYDDRGTHLRIRAHPAVLARLRAALELQPAAP
jgi:GTP-binding protein HflX